MTRLCPYCAADPDGTLDDCLRALFACPNCRADLSLGGDWTGDGVRAIKRLVARFGKDVVLAADRRLAAERRAVSKIALCRAMRARKRERHS